MLCLPDTTQMLLLKAVLNDNVSEGYTELLAWQNATDFQGHLHKSAIQMLPMIWQKYTVQLAENPLKARFGGLYKRSFYTNSQLVHQLTQVIDVLERRRFQYAFTKEVALHYFLDSDSGSHPMNAMDILIEQQDFVPAIDALRQLGYAPTQPINTIAMDTTGHVHTCTLRHNSLKDIILYRYPTPLHNQKLTNRFFLEDASVYNFRGINIRFLSPLKLGLFLLINYQFSDSWHWIADVVLLHKKYTLPLDQLRPIVQQTGLYHSTYQQLTFLWDEFGIGSPEEVSFYKHQSLSLTDKYVMEARNTLGLKWRVALIAGGNGLADKKRMSLALFYAIIRWHYQAVRRTPYRKIPEKSINLLRNVLNLH